MLTQHPSRMGYVSGGSRIPCAVKWDDVVACDAYDELPHPVLRRTDSIGNIIGSRNNILKRRPWYQIENMAQITGIDEDKTMDWIAYLPELFQTIERFFDNMNGDQAYTEE